MPWLGEGDPSRRLQLQDEVNHTDIRREAQRAAAARGARRDRNSTHGPRVLIVGAASSDCRTPNREARRYVMPDQGRYRSRLSWSVAGPILAEESGSVGQQRPVWLARRIGRRRGRTTPSSDCAGRRRLRRRGGRLSSSSPVEGNSARRQGPIVNRRPCAVS